MTLGARGRRRRRSPSGARWRSGRCAQPLAVVGVVIAVAWLLVAVFAPLIAPYDPLAQNFALARRRRRARTCSAPTSSAATSSAA